MIPIISALLMAQPYQASGTIGFMMCLHNYMISFMGDMFMGPLRSNIHLIHLVIAYSTIHQCMVYFSIKVPSTILSAVILMEPSVIYQGSLSCLEWELLQGNWEFVRLVGFYHPIFWVFIQV